MLRIARHHSFALPAPIPHDRPYADAGGHTVLCLADAGAVTGDRRSLDTHIPCHNPHMRHLTATLCLTLAVFLGSAGVSWSADFQKGLTAYQSGD